MIAVKDFSYRYPQTEAWALNALDFEIPTGQFCAVIGPNGAGKSTLAYALSGFVPHFFRGECKGAVLLNGEDLAQANLGALSAEVGLVFQNPFNQISGARYSVREEVAFGLENLGVPPAEMETRIHAALETVGLLDVAERSPFALSGGQQQRVALAAMLAMRPKLLILDEPTSQLDPQGTQEVFAALDKLTASGQTTVVLIEHKLEWVAVFADRVFLLDQGRITASGEPSEVYASEAMRASGLPSTRYARAVEALAQRGLLPEMEQLPVTLEQSREALA